MLRHQVVIQKDRIVHASLKKLSRLRHVAGDVDQIAFESLREPFAATLIIFEQKNPYRMTPGMRARNSQLMS